MSKEPILPPAHAVTAPSDPALERVSRALVVIALVLMCAAAGLVVWFTVRPPSTGFRIAFGPEVYVLVIGASLRNRSRWALAKVDNARKWLPFVGALGIPWNLGFAYLTGLTTLGVIAAVLCALGLAFGLELRRSVPLIDLLAPGWTDQKAIPRWTWVVVAVYGLVMVPAVVLLFMASDPLRTAP